MGPLTCWSHRGKDLGQGSPFLLASQRAVRKRDGVLVSWFQFQLAPYPAILRRSGGATFPRTQVPSVPLERDYGYICCVYCTWGGVIGPSLKGIHPAFPSVGWRSVRELPQSWQVGKGIHFPSQRLPPTSAHESLACLFLSDTSSNTLAGCPTISSSRNTMVYEPLPQIATGQHTLVATLALLVVVVMISTCS